MQIASFVRSILCVCVACLAIPYFPTLSHKRHDFREKVTERKMRFGFLYFRLKKKISHPKKNLMRNRKCK